MPMTKPGIRVSIPSFGEVHVKTLCSDFTGTLSLGGELVDGVAARLHELAKLVDIHVVTSDTNDTAREALAGLPVVLHRVEGHAPHHEVPSAITSTSRRSNPGTLRWSVTAGTIGSG
jgi:soluble P-type ATPase